MLELGLSGKRGLVVGTGAGMGRACVRALAEGGSAVACMDISPEAAGDSAAAARLVGVKSLVLVGDSTKRDDVESNVAKVVEEFGGVDFAVNIVGGTKRNWVLDVEDADWDLTFDQCVRNAMYVAQATAREMVKQKTGGAIVSIASIGGMTGLPRQSAYSAAKAALIALTKTLALELAPANIRVNVVSPGVIYTPGMAANLTLEQARAQETAVPLRRMGSPDDIAKVVTFLLSDLASYVTGVNLPVDGGATAKYPLPAFWAE